MAQTWQHKMVPNSPRSISQFCTQMAFLCLQKKKIFFLKQMKYVELTCLFGGSTLSWSVVLVVLL
jgi:hypothetical protein